MSSISEIPSAATSIASAPVPAEPTPTTLPVDIDGNSYSLIPNHHFPTFIDPITGSTTFLATEQFAPGVDTLVRCSLLPEEKLDQILEEYSKEGREEYGGVEISEVSFQRFKNNEDRTFVAEFDEGVLTGVFDGHVGDQASSYAYSVFPSLLASALSSAIRASPNSSEAISSALSSAFTSFDASIGSAVLQLFDSKPIDEWEEAEVKEVLKENNEVVRRAMAGTTALVAFVPKGGKEVWVAGVGDCQGFLGRKVGEEWTATPLNEEHNGKVKSEVERLNQEHPGESETVVTKGRVLGSIAITRAFGDFPFKFPASFTHRIFQHATPPFERFFKLSVCLSNSFTPPYISATPSITHHSLLPGDIILLASDGLSDSGLVGEKLSSERKAKFFKALAKGDEMEFLEDVAREVGHGILKGVGGNRARRVLENVLWGTDRERKAFQLTAELPEGGLLQDDISVVVIKV
ncbi:pyruvate dehydrogenase phosphatase, partial [Phenoliferia sp. Uapishka_3]